MSTKVMLIDDDVSLLNTLERNLCADFDIITADGGEVGLTRLELDGHAHARHGWRSDHPKHAS